MASETQSLRIELSQAKFRKTFSSESKVAQDIATMFCPESLSYISSVLYEEGASDSYDICAVTGKFSKYI